MEGGTGNDWLLGEVVDDRYAVARRLGGGAMGVVYLAYHRDLDRWVALKVLRAELSSDERLVQRFRREARAASAIGHPNIIHVYDFGRLRDGSAYIVMEHFEGESLGNVLTREGRLPVARAIGIVMQLCDALGVAHECGVVHRDVKPDNVLVGARDMVKILDFGVAKVEGRKEQITQTNELVGTPLYMAPEQWRGIAVDARTDVYALGAMFFEMIAGRPPFLAESLNAIIYQHLSDTPPRADSINPRVPAELATIIGTCLAKSPTMRPQSMRALANALSRVHSDGADDLGFVSTMMTPVEHLLPPAAHVAPPSIVVTPPLGSAVGPVPPLDERRAHAARSSVPLLLVAIGVGLAGLVVSAVGVYLVLGAMADDAPEVGTPVIPVGVLARDAAIDAPDAPAAPDAGTDGGTDAGHARPLRPATHEGEPTEPEPPPPHMNVRPHDPDIDDPWGGG